MSVLLIVVGAIVAVLGLGAVGYGFPVKEFSFGNTLILAGTISVVGGLIILAVGIAIGHLQRVAEMLAHTPLQPSRPAETFAAPPPAAPFPAKAKPGRAETIELALHAPPPPFPAVGGQLTAVPTLRNPDAPVPPAEHFEVPGYEDASLSPQQPISAAASLSESEPLPAQPSADKFFFAAPPHEHRPESPPAAAGEPQHPFALPMPPPPRMERQAPPSYFDTMWPPESRPPKPSVSGEPSPMPKPGLPLTAESDAPGEPAAILKSGVVDGMAYTLYVDGSIEAELPNGTIRFASINELRDHLAKSA